MKKIAIVVFLLAGLASAHAAPLRPQRLQRLQNLQPGVRPNAGRAAVRRSVVQDALFTFYVRQFQQDRDFTPEVVTKIQPFLDEYLQDRFEISERRTGVLGRMRQAIARNASEDDLKRLNGELDMADTEFQSNHERFLSNVDPFLNARQQAKVRILQNMTDNRIRQMLDAIQNPNNPRRANNPATRED